MAIRLNGVYKESTVNKASDMAHGTYLLANNPALYEPQRTNNFEFVCTDLDNIVRAGANGDEENARIANAQEILRIGVASASVPHFTQGVIEIRKGNSVIKAAGVPTFPSGSLVVDDFIGAGTKDVLMAWQHLSYNAITEKVGLMGDYKKDCYLIEYTPDWQEVRRWKLRGCWISGLTEGEFNKEEEGRKQVTATIEYDSAIPDMSELQ